LETCVYGVLKRGQHGRAQIKGKTEHLLSSSAATSHILAKTLRNYLRSSSCGIPTLAEETFTIGYTARGAGLYQPGRDYL
jgi:hypothetical protein